MTKWTNLVLNITQYQRIFPDYRRRFEYLKLLTPCITGYLTLTQSNLKVSQCIDEITYRNWS